MNKTGNVKIKIEILPELRLISRGALCLESPHDHLHSCPEPKDHGIVQRAVSLGMLGRVGPDPAHSSEGLLHRSSGRYSGRSGLCERPPEDSHGCPVESVHNR